MYKRQEQKQPHLLYTFADENWRLAAGMTKESVEGGLKLSNAGGTYGEAYNNPDFANAKHLTSDGARRATDGSNDAEGLLLHVKNTGDACDVIVLVTSAMLVTWKQTVNIPGGMTEYTAIDLPMDDFVVNSDNANISRFAKDMTWAAAKTAVAAEDVTPVSYTHLAARRRGEGNHLPGLPHQRGHADDHLCPGAGADRTARCKGCRLSLIHILLTLLLAVLTGCGPAAPSSGSGSSSAAPVTSAPEAKPPAEPAGFADTFYVAAMVDLGVLEARSYVRNAVKAHAEAGVNCLLWWAEESLYVEEFLDCLLYTSNEMIDRYIHFSTTTASSTKQEWRRSRCATPPKTQFFPTRRLFYAVLT